MMLAANPVAIVIVEMHHKRSPEIAGCVDNCFKPCISCVNDCACDSFASSTTLGGSLLA